MSQQRILKTFKTYKHLCWEHVVPLVLKSVKNPRSALCKTGLMTMADLFTSFRDSMLDHLDTLLLQLLLKASQDKKFVCEEADRALLAMTSSLTPPETLKKLQPYAAAHKNPRVRAKATVSFHNSSSRLDPQGVKDYGLETLIKVAGQQVSDQLPEAREAARKLALELHQAYKQTYEKDESQQGAGGEAADEAGSDAPESAEDGWQRLCQSQLSPTNAQAILRATCISVG
eukprot:jgi/Mesen1/5869/ME000298S05122